MRALFPLFSLFCLLITSCDTPQEIGVELQADGQLIETLYTDTLTVRAELFLDDSIRTDAAENFLVGRTDDPEFGTYSAESYLKINMGSRDSLIFVNNEGLIPSIDSIVLVLALENTQGDTTKPIELGLFPLLQAERNAFLDTLNYYQFNSFGAESTPIETVTYPNELTEDRTLRMLLDTNIIAANLKDGILFDEDLKEDFESFLLAPTNPEATDVILGFNGGRSRMVAYYSYPGDSTSTNVTFFLNKRFSHTEYDFDANSPLQVLGEQGRVSTTQTNNRIYLQAGTGIVARLTFPYLEQFAQEEEFRVHRAELRLPTVTTSISEDYQPPTSVFFFESDLEGDFRTSDTGGEIPVPFEGLPAQALFIRYNANGQNYSDANMTTYLQRILDGQEDNNGVILNVSGNDASLNRVIFQDPSAMNSQPLKLRLFYTLVR